MKKNIDKKWFMGLMSILEPEDDTSIFAEYEDGREVEFVFRKTRFIGEEIILYGFVDDFTIGIIQDTYSATKKEMLEMIWNEDISDYDTRKVYIKTN